MKTLALLTTLLAGSIFLAPQAQAAKVGKLAGIYSGKGTLTDKRTAPMQVYRYTFKPLKVKVSATGVITGSATVIAEISTNGSPFLPIITSKVTVSGKLKAIKITKTKSTATGMLVFSDGTKVDGKFTVATKTGKGTFIAKAVTPDYDVNFTVSKSK
jgi:hypothetical protein